MAASFLEIVELPTGEIVLRRSDEDGEPLLVMKFSEEAKLYLEGEHLQVAKVMFDAGMQEVAELTRPQSSEEEIPANRVLH
ncbi:hypothetical protein [Endozoicomonas numazuensis]|uniref:Uncharacterized protein n=1 Tax=Endozoicomonas numazuensis TaxID=1137799 RepID=A0A081N9C7_9GAMM|nr:hypothetical protein [Endozoicomonas numazuensis]KEQ15050.1 hypothetical protein GZ78_24535 [Endozoicomonas numazuensis]